MYSWNNTETFIERVGSRMKIVVATSPEKLIEIRNGDIAVSGFDSIEDLLETLSLVSEVNQVEVLK